MNLPPGSNFLESVPLLLCEGESDERFLDRIFNTRELKAQQDRIVVGPFYDQTIFPPSMQRYVG